MSGVASRSGRRLLTYQAVAVGIFLGGMGLSSVLYIDARGWERQSVHAELELRARQRAEVVQSTVLKSLEALHGAVSFFETRGRIDRGEFAAFVQSALHREPELHALAWTPRVTGAERAEYESRARGDGIDWFEITVQDASGRMVRAPAADEYYPVYFIEPSARNLSALGFDLASDASRKSAMALARGSGAPAATAPIRLVQDGGQHVGLVVYAPAYRRDTHQLAGYCSAVFSIDELLARSSNGLDAEGLEFTVTDPASSDTPLIHHAPPGPIADMSASALLSVCQQNWVVTLRPTALFVSAHTTGHPMTLLAAGVAISALLSAYFRRAIKQKLAVEQRVLERTLELSREVAERRRAEEAAHLAEANYREIFENSVEGIFQSTPDGQYLRANRALAQIYGYETPADLMAHLADIAVQLYVKPGRRQEFVELAQTQGFVSDFESQVYRRDGSAIWISENARAVRDSAGRLLHYEGMVIDVTARKEAVDTLRRNREELEERVRERTAELAESNLALQTEIVVRQRAEQAADSASRAKSEFLANISHEIRTPMNAIVGYAQLLYRDRALSADQRDAVETIMTSGHHLTDLLQDVLDISKIEAGRLEMRPVDLDLRAMAVGIAGMFRHKCEQKGISLKVEAPCGDRVCGDERALRQVLINLLGNAVKFTAQGSVKLTILASPVGEGSFLCKFEVADTGEGIAPEARQQVFEPFRQGSAGRKCGGTGLGLAIAQRLVGAMGGKIELDSTVGGGSRFHFSICMARAQSSRLRRSRPRVAVLAPGCRVRALVVDDVVENRQVLAKLLTQIGCEVASAANGVEALAQSVAGCFDILFLDVLMPEMDGRQLARQIRQQSTVCLVAVSASALAHEQQDLRDAGFDHVIVKPVRCESLYHCLDVSLGVSFSDLADAPDAQDSRCQADPSLLPTGLRQRLAAAAELYSVTELKQCIDEIERQTASPPPLMRFLRRCVQAYDMDAITRWVTEGSASAELIADARPDVAEAALS